MASLLLAITPSGLWTLRKDTDAEKQQPNQALNTNTLFSEINGIYVEFVASGIFEPT